MPSGALLAARRRRSFAWGYGHIALFGSVVATGGGLHAAAFSLEGASALGRVGTLLTVAVPVTVYVVTFTALFGALSRERGRVHVGLAAASLAVVAAAVTLVAAGTPLVWGLLVLALVPWVTVVGHGLAGRRAEDQAAAVKEVGEV